MKWIAIFLIGCLVLVGTKMVWANEKWSDQQEEWSKTALKITNSINKKQFLVAKEELTKLSTQFAEANFAHKNLSVAGIRALSDTILELEQELNRLMPNEQKMKIAALRLSIAFDTLSHPYQPLWKQYYDPLKERLLEVKQAVHKNKTAELKEAIYQFTREYKLIHPALIISKSKPTIQKLDSLIMALQRVDQPEMIQSSIKELENILYPLFFGSEKDVMAAIAPFGTLPFYWVLLWVSGFIILILAYVGWRKYQGEEQIAHRA
jgi:sporulation protein YpjB